MKRIGVLTSGGDASGMNAAVRAVVRTAAAAGCAVVGIRNGFKGLLEEDFCQLPPRSVADILQRGGTILGTARCPEFRQPDGPERAVEIARRHTLEGMVVIGGDGSLKGAIAMAKAGLPVVGIPATVDNDIPCSEYTLGFDTAVNVVIEAIDRIRDTATSHERTFVVEVMGRESGAIAMESGLAAGAEAVLVPEHPYDLADVAERIRSGFQKGKKHGIVVVAEGAGSGIEIGRSIQAASGLETRVTVLGHVQRGGSPTARDRLLAAELGARAVTILLAGEATDGQVVVVQRGQIANVPLATALTGQCEIPAALLDLVEVLAR